MFGIDKTELRNIKVEAIDLNVLKFNPKIMFNLASDNGYSVKEYGSNKTIQLDRIYIKDNYLFNVFRLDYKKDRGSKIYYTSLDITINTKENTRNNVNPLSVSEYIDKINNIKDYLKDRYGIYIYLQDCRFHEIEINITEFMEYEFEEYKLLFEAIRLKRNQKVYPCYSPIEKHLKYGTHKVYSKVMELKFYNKTKQVYDAFKIQIDSNCMRLEYTLKGYDKIKDKLGTTSPFDLTMDTLRSFLNESVKTDVFKPIEAYINESNKKLIKMYRNVKKQNKKGYIKEFTHKANSKDSVIFDMNQVLDIIKTDAQKSKNYSKYKKIVNEIMSDSLKGNLDKYKEFKVKFFIK